MSGDRWGYVPLFAGGAACVLALASGDVLPVVAASTGGAAAALGAVMLLQSHGRTDEKGDG